MHTEKDARKLWCPLVRLVVITNDSNNNVLNKASFNKCLKEGTGDARIPVGAYCIASSCMMWQWLDDEERMEERRGFCGLARR